MEKKGARERKHTQRQRLLAAALKCQHTFAETHIFVHAAEVKESRSFGKKIFSMP